MKKFCFVVVFFVLFFLSGHAFSAFAESPSIKIVSPDKDSVVSSKFNLQFSVQNFNLTAKPEESSSSGVIQLYVDGAFFDSVASSSATLSLPKTGTHFIQAELVHVSRQSFVPRITDTLYVHVGKKTPYMRVMNLENDQTIYETSPSLDVELENVEQGQYYQVFVDGAVDGDSRESPTMQRYAFLKALPVGKHKLKLALYTEEGRPVSPVVETNLTFVYSSDAPRIAGVEFPKEAVIGADVPFKMNVTNFVPGKDGYIATVSDKGQILIYESAEGILSGLKKGTNKVSFTLFDLHGRSMFLEPPIEKIIEIKDLASANSAKVNSNGIFVTGQDENRPRWIFIGLATIEAITIIIFAVLLFRHDKDKSK